MRLVRVAFLLLAIAVSSFAQTTQVIRSPRSSESTVLIAPQHQAVVRAIQKDMFTYVPPPPTSGGPSTATFIVTYNGFTGPAQNAFQFAVNVWSTILTSSIPIRVTANWTALPPNILGSASAATLARDFPNAPQAGTWYSISLAEKLAGADINLTTEPDINANFNNSFAGWYFGTDGNTPPGQYDFVSVVLHELAHGLTFFGSMTVSGGQGSWGLGTPFPVTYDRFTQNAAGQSLINTTLFPNPSAALATQLQSNAVYFNGPEAVTANGGTRPPLYAPSPWIQGSSYSHLNETTYPAGNANSLMTPEFGAAEAIHSPGPVTLGMFRDMGWTTGGGGGSGFIKYEERFATLTPPPGWRVVDNDGGGTPIGFRQLIVFANGDTVRPQTGASFWFGSFNGANGNRRIDEYLIGPRINNIVSGDSLYFYAGAIGGQFHDSLRVFISTTDSNLSSFTNQIAYFRVIGPVGSWHLYGFSLSQFAGSHIFFAVNYFIVDGGASGAHSDNVWIDHFIVTTDIPVSVQEVETPSVFALGQNYPNPFNPSTNISFHLPEQTRTELSVFDMLGRRVATLLNEVKAPGSYEVKWNASDAASGTYLYRLTTQKQTLVRRMVLLK